MCVCAPRCAGGRLCFQQHLSGTDSILRIVKVHPHTLVKANLCVMSEASAREHCKDLSNGEGLVALLCLLCSLVACGVGLFRDIDTEWWGITPRDGHSAIVGKMAQLTQQVQVAVGNGVLVLIGCCRRNSKLKRRKVKN